MKYLSDLVSMIDAANVRDTDILVVGAGPAGLMAAYSAAQAGSRVIVVDAAHEVGGNAIWATGYLALVGTDHQAAHQIRDGIEVFLADAQRELDRDTEFQSALLRRELVEVFCREAGEAARVLESVGIEFGRYIDRPQLHSVERLVAVDNIPEFGRLFHEYLLSMGVQFLLGTRVKSLLHEQDGAIGGAWAERVDAHVGSDVSFGNWDLSRGLILTADCIILASGGYQANPDVRAMYGPSHHAHIPHQGIGTCVGDGHIMAASAGALLYDMHIVPRLVQVGSGFVQDTLAVNVLGLRFHDEPGRYEDRVAALESQPEQKGFYIADSVIYRNHERITDHMPGMQYEAESIAELAQCIGAPVETLEATVAQWNHLVRSGQPDMDFGRTLMPVNKREISSGPFYAFEMVVGVGFSAGGVRVDSTMNVLDAYGDAISGLYAAGDVLSGLNSAGGLGGTHIASAATFGMVAGAEAAKSVVSERIDRPMGFN